MERHRIDLAGELVASEFPSAMSRRARGGAQATLAVLEIN